MSKKVNVLDVPEDMKHTFDEGVYRKDCLVRHPLSKTVIEYEGDFFLLHQAPIKRTTKDNKVTWAFNVSHLKVSAEGIKAYRNEIIVVDSKEVQKKKVKYFPLELMIEEKEEPRLYRRKAYAY